MDENLILFLKKFYKLEKSSFWEWATSGRDLSNIEAILDGNWLAHDGLNEEALDAFCLNLRFLIQPRDGFSIEKISEYSDAWPEKYAQIKNQIKNAIDKLNQNLNLKSLVQINQPKITTNKEIFEVIFYGGIAHCNQDKREKFKEIVTSGLFSYFVFQSFVSTLFHYRNCIKTLAPLIADYLSMQSIKFALFAATSRLNTEEAALEAQLLLQHVLNVNRAWLIAHEGDALEPNIHAVFEALLKRRLNGEPIAYILGYREFYGLKLKVTPDTLIPRPDTEALVEAALAKISPSPQPSPASGRGSFCVLDPKILDLGTGTGAIALAIAQNRPQALVTATDASEKALNVAKENAQNLGITNITFLHSNWFDALQDKCFDVIVSNPPYIEQDDAHLTQGDLRYEPISALASGQDGLDDIRQIISAAPKHLNPHGCLLLEHGYNQAESVAALLCDAGFSEIETIKDLGGNNRVTLGMV